VYKIDQIKVILALIVFGSIGVLHFFFGKEVGKWAALFGLAIWFGGMYFLNRRA